MYAYIMYVPQSNNSSFSRRWDSCVAIIVSTAYLRSSGGNKVFERSNILDITDFNRSEFVD